MYCVLAKDMALVMVDIYGESVSLRLAPQRSTENVVFVERITARILFADKAFICVLL
jgi:hypothetical protein